MLVRGGRPKVFSFSSKSMGFTPIQQVDKECSSNKDYWFGRYTNSLNKTNEGNGKGDAPKRQNLVK